MPRLTAVRAHPVNSSSFGGPECDCVEQRVCRSCTQRRLYVWRLIDVDGLTCEQAATRVGLSARRVSVLVAYERDRRELVELTLDSIPVARVRSFLERELGRDPALTRAEVAHRLCMRQADLDRQLSSAASGDSSRQHRVGIRAAGRLVIALGRAPYELDGC
jgi:DNA-binding transcriptional regulator LsrR (DeoR family)